MKKRKLFTLLLCFIMLASMLPVLGQAEEPLIAESALEGNEDVLMIMEESETESSDGEPAEIVLPEETSNAENIESTQNEAVPVESSDESENEQGQVQGETDDQNQETSDDQGQEESVLFIEEEMALDEDPAEDNTTEIDQTEELVFFDEEQREEETEENPEDDNAVKLILSSDEIPAGAIPERVPDSFVGSRKPGAKNFGRGLAGTWMFPQETTSEDDRRVKDEEGYYVFRTIDELKELVKFEYAEWTEAYYAGREPFQLEEDLRIPANLDIQVNNYRFTVSAGTTLTVAEGAQFTAVNLLVEGTIINEGTVYGPFWWKWEDKIEKTSTLRVNGAIENYGLVEYYAGISGLENIHNLDLGYVIQDHGLATEEDIISMINSANADSDESHWYEGYVFCTLVIQSELELPVDCAIYVPQVNLGINPDGILRIINDGTYMSYIQAYNGGSIEIQGSLANNGGIDLFDTSKLSRFDPLGYTGSGWVGVEDNGTDPFSSSLIGFSASEFKKTYNSETLFWTYWLIDDGYSYQLNVKEIQLFPGGTCALSGVEKATGRRADVSAVSKNPSVATVDANSIITGIKIGRTTVTATAGEETQEIPTTIMFSDVADSGQYYFNPVYWAVENGVTSGTSPSTFSPNKECTRGQIVTFLWKAMGSPEPNSTNNPFTDVKISDYFYKPVLWAKEKGITSGTSATTFSPGKACTRGQIVTFLWIASGRPEPSSTSNPFQDVKTSEYFFKSVLWAKEKEVTSGTSATTFSPGKSCTRAQAMTFLWKSGAGESVIPVDGGTLSVFAWDAEFNIPALRAAEMAFQKIRPGFKLDIVDMNRAGAIEEAITQAAVSGDLSELPDIVLFQDHFIQNYVNSYPNVWKSLEGAEIDWNDFLIEKVKYSTVGGVHYGIPVDNGTVVFAYRTDILAQCGYSLANVTGISWNQWLEIARNVKNTTGMALLSVSSADNDMPYIMMQAEGLSQWKNGAPNFAGNESFRRVIETIVQGIKDGTIILAEDWSAYTDGTILGNQVAGVMNGNWIIPTIRQVADNSGKWGVTTLPTLDGGKEGYAANGGSSLCITGNCKNTDLAKEFLTYTFGGGEGAKETYDNALLNGGVITCCISAGNSDVYRQGDVFFNGQPIYADIAAMGAHVPAIEQSSAHYSARYYIGNAIKNIVNGADIDAEIENVQRLLESEMGR